MKSNYRKRIVTQDKLRDALKSEFEKNYNELFEFAKNDITAQVMAVCCYDLNKEFGFGKERMQRFVSGVSSYFELMLTEGVLGQPFTTQNCIDYLKREFGIDIQNGGNNNE